MKKSVLFVLFALISVAGFSQITGWNAKVGMNFSNYTGDLDLNAKVGFKLGVADRQPVQRCCEPAYLFRG